MLQQSLSSRSLYRSLNDRTPDSEPNDRGKRRRVEPGATYRAQRGNESIRQAPILTSRALDPDQDADELWAGQSFYAAEAHLSILENPVDFNFDLNVNFWGDPIDSDLSRAGWEQEITSLLAASSDSDQSTIISDVLFPNVPSPALRQPDYNLLNPFAKGSVDRYNKPREVFAVTKEREVNGYIKFRLQPNQAGLEDTVNVFGSGVSGVHHRHPNSTQWRTPTAVIPLLPPNFGRGLKLDTNDQKLLTFYLTAYCQGRTLIPKHNFWLTEIAPMAETYPLVQEALLALAGSYVLDYVHTPSLMKRTSHHYARASELISEALVCPDHHAVGKSDAIVAALILMEAEDEVIWELRRPKTEVPNFHRGNLLARAILDHSDPGYRYWKSCNVQYTRSWTGMSACVAVGCILAEMMSPCLPSNSGDRNYAWLLGGSRKEVHTIYGAKGFSPKLIHILAQITRLSAELKDTPESVVIPMAAKQIKTNLDKFRQRSELSEGYSSTAELLESCTLDENGKVHTAKKVTELAGDAWLCTAKIYLHCRLFRKPPSHPDVRRSLEHLMACIKLLPETGPLLTAQSPFFPVFLMAIVSYTPEDRDAAKKWFTAVVSGGGRSNVPPVWEAAQLLWTWLDKSVTDPGAMEFDEDTPLGQRRNWWEDMVNYLIGEVGWMSLT